MRLPLATALLLGACAAQTSQLPAERDPSNPEAPEGVQPEISALTPQPGAGEVEEAPPAPEPMHMHGMDMTPAPDAGSAAPSSAKKGEERQPAKPPLGKNQSYTCPMHPEVVQSTPGKCPKCGMKLVAKEPAATPPPSKAQSYTCAMHPEINQPGPGNCPKCGMKLVAKNDAHKD